MASRKEYEMLFQLNASMGSGYTQTFSKAQQELISMQREVQSLNKLQSDINAYTKQQSAVESTRSKLELLKKQYANIEKELKATGNESSALKNKLLDKQRQIDKTTESLAKQEQKLDTLGSSLKEAGVNTESLTTEQERLKKELEETKRKEEEAGEAAYTLGDRINDAFDVAASAIATSGVVVALTGVYNEFKKCVGIAADFEETMSSVKALSGAQGDEFESLSEKAKELGASTKYTATQAAEAMTYMGMAGWTAEEMLQGMDGVLSLAAASGEDLAQVSDIVTDNLTAFGLKASDTAHFADVLAATATNSNTNVSIMGETFKNSAAIAGALGYSVEDVAIAVGLMANAGYKGAKAGTALKNTFNGLLDGATLTGKALGEYQFSAVKQDGTLKSFKETIEELRVQFSKMTDVEKVNNAMALAGKKTYVGLIDILNATDEDYEKLSEAINDCAGSAQRMAEIKLDNLAGQTTIMQSAFDALKVTIGEDLSPEIKDVVEFSTKAISNVNEFVERNPALIKGLVTTLGTLGAIVGAVTTFNTVSKLAAIASKTLFFGTPIGQIAAIAGGIALATGAIATLISKEREGVESVKKLTDAQRELDGVFARTNETFENTQKQTVATATLAENYTDRLRELEEQGLSTNEAQDEYRLIVDKLNALMPELGASIDDETGKIKGGTDALYERIEAWKQVAIQEALSTKYKEQMSAWADAELEVVENQQKLNKATAEYEVIQDKIATSQEALQKVLEDMDSNRTYIGSGTMSRDEIREANTKYQELQEKANALKHEIVEYEEEARKNTKQQQNLNKAIDEGASSVAKYEEELKNAQETLKAFSTTGTIEGVGSLNAYASGTQNAERGVALVGERGPELVYMQGGERVLNADRTKGVATALGERNTNNISIAFNIQGDAQNGVLEALERYSDTFVERVIEALENASADSRRNAYV